MSRRFIASIVSGFVVCMLATRPAAADTPSVTINSPTGTVYVNSFPYNATLNLTVRHAELKNLHVLDVLVNGVSLFASAVGDPFDTSNGCKSPNLTSVTTTCSTNGSDEATFGIPWTVAGPGTYTVTVSIKHQNAIGEDEETVTFSLVAVEYPAPPAIANAYINRTFPKSAAKVRGCVISQIAEKHAHDSAYGPKGGPYDSTLVEADVLSFWAACGGQ